MQSHSSSTSLDTLKESLLRAVDADYNVLHGETVLNVISQLERMELTRDQLHATRLGREINTIRQKIDARKHSLEQTDGSSPLILSISQRAKRLLRSWQGLLNAGPDVSPAVSKAAQPRLILKVKFNGSHTKRKRGASDTRSPKRKKPLPAETTLKEFNHSLPRLKTTQQLLMQMQMNEPHLLATQSSTANAILQRKIIDDPSTQYQRAWPSSTVSPLIQSTRCKVVVQRLSSKLLSSSTNVENDHLADSVSSTSEPPPLVAARSKRKRSYKHESKSIKTEQSPVVLPELAAYETVADLVADHRRRILATHDAREIEARPNLLLAPIDQLALAYERDRTLVDAHVQPADLIALPFIDCPLEFDLLLDELVIDACR